MKENACLDKKEVLFYRIGDLVFKIISDLPYKFPEENAADFRIEETQEDYTYIFKKVENIPECTGTLRLIEDTIASHELINDQGRIFRGFLYGGNCYDSIVEIKENGGIIYYLSAEILAERHKQGFNFINYLALDVVFGRRDALILHSSHIVVNDKALLFSAASGVGKSTQAELWRKYANGKVINGDRALLRKRNRKWHAYGCPMCGSSGIHLQSDTELKAIVMLEQGVNNEVERLTSSQAFSLLYPQITASKRNSQRVLQIITLLEDLIASVPIYKFSCTKTEDAVVALKQIIDFA